MPAFTGHTTVLDYLQAIEADYQPRTIDDISGYVGTGRGLVEDALQSLVQDGFVRKSGEFWLPLNPASALPRFD
jgi:predicted transcriptional regulator